MNQKKYRVPIYSLNEAKHIAFELQTSLRMRLSDDDMQDLMTIVFIPVIKKYAIKQNDSYIAFFESHSDAFNALLSIGA